MNRVIRQSLAITLTLCTAMLGLTLINASGITAVPAAWEYETVFPLQSMLHQLSSGNPMISGLIWAALTIMNCILITRICLKNQIFQARSYIPFTLYVALCCLFPPNISMRLDILAASTFILLGTKFFTASFRRTYAYGKLFRASLLLGTAPLLYPASSIYFLMFPIGIFIFRRTAREFLASLAGLLLPVVSLSYILWSVGYTGVYPIHGIINSFTTVSAISFDMDPGNIIRICTAGIVLLSTFYSILLFVSSSGSMRTRAYKLSAYMLYLLVITLLFVFSPRADYSILIMASIPLSVINFLFLGESGKRISHITYYLVIAGCIAANVYQILF